MPKAVEIQRKETKELEKTLRNMKKQIKIKRNYIIMEAHVKKKKSSGSKCLLQLILVTAIVTATAEVIIATTTNNKTK